MNLIEILINEPFKLTIQSLLMMVNLLKPNEEKPMRNFESTVSGYTRRSKSTQALSESVGLV